MTRRFHYEGEQWEVDLTGGGHGVGTGNIPPITNWGVWFWRVSDPEKKIFGLIHNTNLNQLHEEELIRILKQGLKEEKRP